MRDYAKINTKEKFNWGEALISALLLPCVFAFFVMLKVAL